MTDYTFRSLGEALQQAYAFREQKRLDDAFTIAKKCLELAPNEPDVHSLMGVLSHDKKNFFESEKAFTTAITLRPENADYYFYLGQLLLEQKRFQEAENIYLECIKRNKNHLLATFQLGSLYEISNRHTDAARLFNDALKINPNYMPIYYHLGVVYHKQNRLEEAIDCYDKALKSKENDIATLSNMGAALTRDRQFLRALPYYEKALALKPDYVPAITNLGGTYIEMNQYDKGQEYMRKALALEPNLPANWRNLTLCTKFDPKDTTDLNNILALMEKTPISDEDMIHFHFALGKIYNDYKEYEKSFAHYQEGNALQSKRSVFMPEAFAAHVNRIIKIDKQVTLESLANDTPANPLIIMGTARSGKTLLESILKQHPQIGGVGELGISDIPLKLPLELRPKTNYPYWLKNLTAEQAQAIKNAYSERLFRLLEPDQRYVIDTMPGNYMYLRLIAALYPKVKFIHCQRNPLDTCLLMFFKYFIDGHGYSYDLERLGRYYKQYLSLMNYWRDKLPQNVLTVNYEELIERPQETLNAVMEYLELNPDYGFNTENFHSEEVELWRHYERHLGPLKKAIAEDLPIFEEKDEKAAELKELIGSAYLSLEQGDTITAEILCRTVLENEPAHYVALHLLGVVYAQRAEYEKSVECFEKAVKVAPNVIQLHLDMSKAYKEVGQQMKSEQHFKIAENLKAQRVKDQIVVLDHVQRNELMSAFNTKTTVIDEYESRVLLEGMVSEDNKTDSFMTRSWDTYFTDLSSAGFRNIQSGTRRSWQMRAWHFAYKNISLAHNIYNQAKQKIRILDIGCSTGYLRRILEGNYDLKENKKIYYWGLDIRQDVLEDAVKATDDIESGAYGNNIPSAFIVQDIKHGLPYHDKFFDYVVCFEMIKYLPVEQGKQLIANIRRVLSPKGLFFLSSSYSADHPGYIQSTPFEQLEEILKRSGFEIIGRRGSQSTIQTLISGIQEKHQPLVKDLLAVHPPEMVAAMITPLYPQRASQVTFICRVKE